MLNFIKRHFENRRNRAFMLKEARRLMMALNMAPQAIIRSDKAVLALCVGFGVGFLRGLDMANKFHQGTDRVLRAVMDDERAAVH